VAERAKGDAVAVERIADRRCWWRRLVRCAPIVPRMTMYRTQSAAWVQPALTRSGLRRRKTTRPGPFFGLGSDGSLLPLTPCPERGVDGGRPTT
jgi:hypothetical protein